MISPVENDYGIVLAGHGSRDPDGVREFEGLVELIRQSVGDRPVTHGFLEFARPTIDEAIRANIEKGAKRVAVVPGLLLAAAHGKNDMPCEVLAAQKEFPEVKIQYGSALHLHPLVLQLCRERIVAAESKGSKHIPRSETCLVVVGRGTTDPDANSDVCKLARFLEEGLGFGGSYVCYSGTAKPLVAEGLKRAGRLGFSRLLIFPFMMFTGILVKRIYQSADDLALSQPELEVVKVDYLGIHDLIAKAFLERASEALEGVALSNCSLCKYRTQIVGYESEAGAPQKAHHLHVRANGSPALAAEPPAPKAYEPHPIERESFEIIAKGRDWSIFPREHLPILQRLVHTTGDFAVADDVYISTGAVDAALRAIRNRATIVTDVTMVAAGLRRPLLAQYGLPVFCAVHDEEARLLAEHAKITRSAAGIRLAFEKFGQEAIVVIGDAPTAVEETVRLVREQRWRPHLVIGLPVGFVGTADCKAKLRSCLSIPRITNSGTRGGSPWAASALNAILITASQQS